MWREFCMALSFLTRLPIHLKGEWDEAAFSRASRFYPLCGLLVGVVLAALAWVCSLADARLAAFITVLAAVVLSGGLHLDGFMDTCDGVFSARGRERALEIMKDSRSGSFGVIGVVLLLLGKYISLTVVIESGVFLSAILCGAVLARLMLVVGLVVFPSARPNGLGVMVKRYVRGSAVLWGIVLLAALALLSFCWLWALALVLSIALTLLTAKGLCVFLGGLTGDTYGLMAELSEFLFFFLAALAVSVCPGALSLAIF